MLLSAALLPWLTIRPAYAYPDPVTAVPTQSQFGPVTFDAGQGAVQLVGVEMAPNQNVAPGGESIAMVLYWRAETAIEKDYLSAVHLLGREFESVGSVNRYPAWGMIPTSRWQPGQIWRDEYQVRVRKTAVAPSQLRVSVTLYDSGTEQPLPATWPDGTAVDLLLVGEPAQLRADRQGDIDPLMPLNIPFNDGITLVGYNFAKRSAVSEANSEAQLLLFWQATSAPTQDYTVFIHFLDANGQWLAGADAPPVNNFYPTSMWLTGEWIDDAHNITLPDGAVTMQIGLYDPDTGTRLPRVDGRDAVDLPVNKQE
jgi:hypothetical protein